MLSASQFVKPGGVSGSIKLSSADADGEIPDRVRSALAIHVEFGRLRRMDQAETGLVQCLGLRRPMRMLVRTIVADLFSLPVFVSSYAIG